MMVIDAGIKVSVTLGRYYTAALQKNTNFICHWKAVI